MLHIFRSSNVPNENKQTFQQKHHLNSYVDILNSAVSCQFYTISVLKAACKVVLIDSLTKTWKLLHLQLKMKKD